MSIFSNIKIATHRSTPSQAISAGAIALVGLTLGAVQASPAPQWRAEDNKRVVIDFYEAGLNRKDFAAASRHLGQQYIQHNPMSSDG